MVALNEPTSLLEAFVYICKPPQKIVGKKLETDGHRYTRLFLSIKRSKCDRSPLIEQTTLIKC